MNVDPNSTYILTTKRTVFEQLRWLIDDLTVYSSNGRTFDGVRYPGAYVLETELSPEEIRSYPYRPPSQGQQFDGNYLYLPSDRDVKLFFNGPKPKRSLKLILDDAKPLQPEAGNQDFLSVLSSVYVIGKNAIKTTGWGVVSGDKLVVIPPNVSIDLELINGTMKVPPKYYYDLGLLACGGAMALLGILLSHQPILWIIYGILFIAIQSNVPFGQPILAALLGVGALMFSWEEKGAVRVFWPILAGLLFYTWFYQPYRLDPLVGHELFTLTLVVAIPLSIALQGVSLSRQTTVANWVIFFLGSCLLAGGWLVAQSRLASKLYFVIMIGLPILMIPFRELRRHYRWPITLAIGSLGVALNSTGEYGFVMYGVISALLWGVWQYSAEPSGSRLRR